MFEFCLRIFPKPRYLGPLRWYEKVILRRTHRLWNAQISRILCRAAARGVINDEQLHILCAAFDPTQRHEVY